MFEWIKKFFNWILAGFTVLLGILFGIERFRRKKTEKDLDAAESENATLNIEKKELENAQEVSKTVDEKINDVTKKSDEKREKVNEGTETYNSIVDDFNRT